MHSITAIVIARNAIYNLVGFGITILVNLLLIPVMLLHLGPTGFGAWAVARVFVSYAMLADFGLSSTVTKYVAEFHAKNDNLGITRVLQSALVMYAVIVLALLALTSILLDLVTRTFFASSGDFAADIEFLVLGSMLVFSVNLIFSVFQSAIAGLQRLDATNAVSSIYWLVNGVLMYLAMVNGFGLRGLVYANGAATATAILLNLIFFFRFFRGLRVFRFAARWADLRQSFLYSKDIFVIAISNSVHLHFDKLLISSFLSLSSVSSYEVASRVIQMIRHVAILLLNPIMPVASELQAQERNDSVTRLYHLSLKYIIAFCVPLFVCVGVFAHPLVALWLGEGNDLIATTLQILIIPNFINLMTGPAYFISLGIGKAKYGMYSNVVGLFINVVLSSVLLRFYGYFGAVAGTIVALTLEAIFFLTLFHRSLAVRWSKSLLLFIRPLVGISLGVTLALAVGYFIELLAVKTFIMVGLTIAIYLFVLFRAAYFDDEDKRYLREIKRSVVEMFPTLPERV